jgi:hypothetical protein
MTPAIPAPAGKEVVEVVDKGQGTSSPGYPPENDCVPGRQEQAQGCFVSICVPATGFCGSMVITIFQILLNYYEEHKAIYLAISY